MKLYDCLVCTNEMHAKNKKIHVPRFTYIYIYIFAYIYIYVHVYQIALMQL